MSLWEERRKKQMARKRVNENEEDEMKMKNGKGKEREIYDGKERLKRSKRTVKWDERR